MQTKYLSAFCCTLLLSFNVFGATPTPVTSTVPGATKPYPPGFNTYVNGDCWVNEMGPKIAKGDQVNLNVKIVKNNIFDCANECNYISPDKTVNNRDMCKGFSYEAATKKCVLKTETCDTPAKRDPAKYGNFQFYAKIPGYNFNN